MILSNKPPTMMPGRVQPVLCNTGRKERTYTRALYGGPAAFRLETSDRPVFAAYLEKNSQHISCWINVPGRGRQVPDSTTYCESRYNAGKGTYRLTGTDWGKGELVILKKQGNEWVEVYAWTILVFDC